VITLGADWARKGLIFTLFDDILDPIIPSKVKKRNIKLGEYLLFTSWVPGTSHYSLDYRRGRAV
jgi:hypothetical protein